MRFWDSSALVPLCLAEPGTPDALAVLREDPVPVVWWASPVECWSAFARLERERRLAAKDVAAARKTLRQLQQAWVEVLPTEHVREHASRLLRMHPLRGADALQLAAALVWAGTPPRDAAFVTRDTRLGEAARLEGFGVLPASLVG